jgi:PIF1-like helicase
MRVEASLIADAFTLNVEQRRAYYLITDHTLHRQGLPDQLLMGVFGEAGTGKTQVIKAVQAWFTRLNRSNELLLTATTGTAAINIDGRTVHNATGIAIEMGDVTRTSRVTEKMQNLWEGRTYMIIDEVSMLSCQTMVSLNAQLMKIKNHPTVIFGDVNLIFFGDFLQFPAVSRLDLYMDRPESKYALGHDLWRSLNAVVILRQQMRQAEDPEYAAMLQRIRYGVASEDDFVKLNTRVSAPLSDFWNTPVIVRRHSVRQAINRNRVQQASAFSGVPITYCAARIRDREGISLHAAYNICAGEGKAKGDGILCLLPGTPLMVMDNINVPHRESPPICFPSQLTCKLQASPTDPESAFMASQDRSLSKWVVTFILRTTCW